MYLNMRIIIAISLLLVVTSLSARVQLQVHEWGTITTHHLSNGQPEGRLNRIRKARVLPDFVHKYAPAETESNPLMQKVETEGRPDITMRLDASVIYFHVPEGEQIIEAFDVKIDFRGGVINEFYPSANPPMAMDRERGDSKVQLGVLKNWDGKELSHHVESSLAWDRLHLTNSFNFSCTEKNLWRASRRVKSNNLINAEGEVERYLFYRGVAHLDALFQTIITNTNIELRAQQTLDWLPGDSMVLPKIWIVDTDELGETAYREITGASVSKTRPNGKLFTMERFEQKAYSYENLSRLKRSMTRTLVQRGLFEDEANAMMETMKESYFNAYGVRAFYIVPREWIDKYLPLGISAPHRLTRVYIGKMVIWED